MQQSTDRVANVGPVKAEDMALRDYFAIHAPNIAGNATYTEQARERYKFADAMLKARSDAS